MKNCKNCKHLFARDICYFCDINTQEITIPLFKGGKKCECYEKRKQGKTKFSYPTKEELEK